MNEAYDIRARLAQMLGGQTPEPSQFTATVQLPEFQPRQQQPMQQQQGQQINPMQAYNQYQQISGMFGGGGSSIGGGGLTSAGRAGAVTSGPSSSAAGGSASGAGSSWGSTAMSAAPWAALAAAIIANESKQRGDGNRGNSGWEQAGDMLTGKVLERDMERYFPHNKAGGATKRAAMMSTPSGAVRNFKDFGSWLGGLFN